MSSPALIYPVILCGGSGTRLWPMSRKTKPKPFLPLIGDTTLFEATVSRGSERSVFGEPIVVAGADHLELVQSQMTSFGNYRLIIEPDSRNTAPAIALAATQLPSDAIMLVCPSDHHIADEVAFESAALAASALARNDWLVSFGSAPEHPETGYGYLRRGDRVTGGFEIAEFVEKPELEQAERYLASGDYSWNGGIFAFRAGALLSELENHRPAMAQAVAIAVAAGKTDGSCFYPQSDAFGEIVGESIDYAVMENTDRAAMVPADMGWSDIGNWAALQDALAASPTAANANFDEAGNAARGSVDFDEGCRNVLAISDGPRISVVGLDDVCIIVSGDEVLVTSRDGAQRVGKIPGAKQQ